MGQDGYHDKKYKGIITSSKDLDETNYISQMLLIGMIEKLKEKEDRVINRRFRHIVRVSAL
ncbi:hypothetical protein HanHA89_Chr11g0443481 [Helianthus annuus]|nr:hypothetical protein HanHA89_Chr11g0443481 [Helianthus annuus]